MGVGYGEINKYVGCSEPIVRQVHEGRVEDTETQRNEVCPGSVSYEKSNSLSKDMERSKTMLSISTIKCTHN